MAELDVEQDYELPETPEERKTFKEFAAEDIDDVFFCLDEFAETHTIDGKEMPLVMEADALQDHSSHWEAGAKQNFDEGLYDARMTIYVKAADYGPAPKVGRDFYLDEDEDMYRILNYEEESGVYRIKVGRVRL